MNGRVSEAGSRACATTYSMGRSGAGSGIMKIEAGHGVGRVDDAELRLAGRKEADDAGGALGDRNHLVAVADGDPDLAQQVDHAGAGRIARGVGDGHRLACDQACNVGRGGVALAGAARGADENQAVAQRGLDHVGADDLAARGSLGGGAGEREDHVAARATVDLREGKVGRRHEHVHARAGTCLPKPADRFQRLLQRRLAVDHEIARLCHRRRHEHHCA